jgi:hypothetical protein
MSELIVTLDIDWACEPAIEETLDFLESCRIFPTVFSTHPSPKVEESLAKLEVGLHPYFDPTSSQGSTIEETVKYVMDLPHNLLAFRCHRFAHCNVSKQAMAEAGMLLSSNVCTDLENVFPFKDRFGLLEVPIFLEDGGYLWRRHPLQMTPFLREKLQEEGPKVILIHPMHFVINTPHFDYMRQIKQRLSRDDWKEMTRRSLKDLEWKGRGIRDLLREIIELVPQTGSLGSLLSKR